MERRLEGAINVSAEFENPSGARSSASATSYGSSHQLCLDMPIDSLTRLFLRSNTPLTVRGIALVTTNK
jgi:hypothetical protein